MKREEDLTWPLERWWGDDICLVALVTVTERNWTYPGHVTRRGLDMWTEDKTEEDRQTFLLDSGEEDRHGREERWGSGRPGNRQASPRRQAHTPQHAVPCPPSSMEEEGRERNYADTKQTRGQVTACVPGQAQGGGGQNRKRGRHY